VLPLVNPVVTARAVATADVLSGGRTVAVSWLREEYDIVGETISNRGHRTAEIIQASSSSGRRRRSSPPPSLQLRT
jgi:alkanesulfonate monooxygenase SsuD/methylene tetrahydromethanopterin reductase-like flavin-dependent oxidoreductase (luciferase family)